MWRKQGTAESCQVNWFPPEPCTVMTLFYLTFFSLLLLKVSLGLDERGVTDIRVPSWWGVDWSEPFIPRSVLCNACKPSQ